MVLQHLVGGADGRHKLAKLLSEFIDAGRLDVEEVKGFGLFWKPDSSFM